MSRRSRGPKPDGLLGPPDTGEHLVPCPYCAGRLRVYEDGPDGFYEAPCRLCGARGTVPAFKRASFLRSVFYDG